MNDTIGAQAVPTTDAAHFLTTRLPLWETRAKINT
jgi:hypothetical protein